MSAWTITLPAQDDLPALRDALNRLVAAGAAPGDVTWRVAGEAAGDDLFGGAEPPPVRVHRAPPGFDALLEDAALCADDGRFALLHTLRDRLTREPGLLEIASDRDVFRLQRMAKSVHRDAHKMTAFVRFRAVQDDGGERFVAWYEPEHHILGRVAPFFTARFAGMRWAILTPRGTLQWDGSRLTRAGPARREDAPAADAMEEGWLGYYAASFNPARVNPELTRSQMPRKFWRNLPEAPLVPLLTREAAARTSAMVAAPAVRPSRRAEAIARAVTREETPMTDAPSLFDLDHAPATAPDLAALLAEAKGCTACPLYRDATQTVFGEGPGDAPVVFVGEQPGDREDLAGKPFVGPAGQLFDTALREAGIDRSRVYVTNAVKHFKFEVRGRRRIHMKPGPAEVRACRPWLEGELAAIRPRLVVALGATAANSLLGRTVTISRERGRIVDAFRPGTAGLITVHPSFLLRLPDAADKEREYARFLDDLALVAGAVPEVVG